MPRCAFALTIAAVIAMSGTVRAGVYCSVDELPYPVPTNVKGVRSKLGDIRGPLNPDKKPEDNPALQKYVKRQKELEAKQQRGELTEDERIDLSGVYLRLQKNGEAIGLLKQADQTNGLVLAHLAAAYLEIGYLDQAVAFEEKALAAWPEVSLRWSLPQLAWYRRAERYFLELLRLRQQEARRDMKVYTNVDALFPRLRFEAPDGRYEVGGPPVKTEDRLQDDAPDDALALVTQLVWWLPFENRLYWLYAELLNYRGDLQGAHTAFEDLGAVGSTRTREMSSKAVFLRHFRAFSMGWRVWLNRHWMAYAVMPRTLQTEPSSLIGYEIGQMNVLRIQERLDDPVKGEEFRDSLAPPVVPPSVSVRPVEAPAPPPPASSGMWLPDWRTVVVSFAAGMLFMALLLFQWREWARRRAPAPVHRELAG